MEKLFIYSSLNEKLFYTKAGSKDVVLMKEGFWHVTINSSGSDFLIMANIVCSDFTSIYEEYKKNKWAAYYYTVDGWVKNENYSSITRLLNRRII